MAEISNAFSSETPKKKETPFVTRNESKTNILLAQPSNQTISAPSVVENDNTCTATTSGDLASLDTTLSRDLEIMDSPCDGVKLSLWLQWTLPKCEMKLFMKDKAGNIYFLLVLKVE